MEDLTSPAIQHCLFPYAEHSLSLMTPPTYAARDTASSCEPTAQDVNTADYADILATASEITMSGSADHQRNVNDLKETLVTAQRFMDCIGELQETTSHQRDLVGPSYGRTIPKAQLKDGPTHSPIWPQSAAPGAPHDPVGPSSCWAIPKDQLEEGQASTHSPIRPTSSLANPSLILYDQGRPSSGRDSQRVHFDDRPLQGSTYSQNRPTPSWADSPCIRYDQGGPSSGRDSQRVQLNDRPQQGIASFQNRPTTSWADSPRIPYDPVSYQGGPSLGRDSQKVRFADGSLQGPSYFQNWPTSSGADSSRKPYVPVYNQGGPSLGRDSQRVRFTDGSQQGTSYSQNWPTSSGADSSRRPYDPVSYQGGPTSGKDSQRIQPNDRSQQRSTQSQNWPTSNLANPGLIQYDQWGLSSGRDSYRVQFDDRSSYSQNRPTSSSADSARVSYVQGGPSLRRDSFGVQLDNKHQNNLSGKGYTNAGSSLSTRPSYSGPTPGNRYDNDGSSRGQWDRSQKFSTAFQKNLTYDGKDGWSFFRRRFTSFLNHANLTDGEEVEWLMSCMTGSACGPVEAELAQNPDICFAELIYNLDRRFEQRGSQYETNRRFFEARQKSGEPLDEWADRVQRLGTLAILNPQFERDAIMAQFCRGLADRMAGRVVAMQTHSYQSLFEAVEAVRVFQDDESEANDSAAYRHKPHIGEVADMFDDCLYEADVLAVQNERQPWRRGPYPRLESNLPSTEQRPVMDGDQVLKDVTAAILAAVEKLAALVTKNNRPQSSVCYNCQQPGHFQADCPLPQAPQRSHLN